MVTIKKITLENLEAYLLSNEFANFKNKPISELRAISYIHNPNSRNNDVVLYLGFIKNELVGYKSVFADTFKSAAKTIRFGWLSGTWTHQNYRRNGISSLLFNEVFKDWEGKLMYTNYANESKAVYDKTEKFQLLNSINGYRHYMRFSFKELLPPKSIIFKKSKLLLGVLDTILNSGFDVRFNFLKIKNKDLYKFNKIEKWTGKEQNFLKSFKENELFCRGVKEFEWIHKYPWIKTDIGTKDKSENYYFSSFANKFKSEWYVIYNSNSGEITGVVLINIRDQQLKIPYIYITPNLKDYLINVILKLCLTHKINHLTIYNDLLNTTFLNEKYLKLKSKKFVQNYFITKELLREFPEIKKSTIQFGDGDVVFT
ncbi:hypothetical protein MHL31_07020 [Lutibacter sp. A80]|uniref:hypothetical protein n=1 Tax=Lutibacter sp. A80 TaxID=2918453 RepID=UPI001F0511B1|nr:hypothetical protein [Lutibacter sp. A80]UMB61938.1 hypothetical protein MHL31_07020 [Lutibacter sp. A80]